MAQTKIGIIFDSSKRDALNAAVLLSGEYKLDGRLIPSDILSSLDLSEYDKIYTLGIKDCHIDGAIQFNFRGYGYGEKNLSQQVWEYIHGSTEEPYYLRWL